jgi:hypothetical protein
LRQSPAAERSARNRYWRNTRHPIGALGEGAAAKSVSGIVQATCINQAILLTPDFGANPPFCFSALLAALVSAAS